MHDGRIRIGLDGFLEMLHRDIPMTLLVMADAFIVFHPSGGAGRRREWSIGCCTGFLGSSGLTGVTSRDTTAHGEEDDSENRQISLFHSTLHGEKPRPRRCYFSVFLRGGLINHKSAEDS
jgi:hypothetical protein